MALQIDTQGNTDRFVDYLLILPDFQRNAIQIDDGIGRVQCS
jgi:hypothetical protein